MNKNCFYILISLLLGLSLTFSFYPISVFPFVISLGIFAIIIKQYTENLKLFFLGGSEDNLIKLKNLISYKYTNIDKRNIYIYLIFICFVFGK